MGDVVSAISTAITLTRRLREISKKVGDAEFANLLGDLSIELGEAKLSIAELLQQNAGLINEVRELKATDFNPCPNCRERTWKIESSTLDNTIGINGGYRRKMVCSSCHFSESVLHML